MKLSKETKDDIRAVSIIKVAEKLGMKLYGMGKVNRRCMCPFHDDHQPSLHLNATKNIFKCFSCGKGGDVIGLVMQVENLKYMEACEWIMNEFSIVSHTESTESTEILSVSSGQSVVETPETTSIVALSPKLVKQARSTSSVFCQSLLSCGYMTYDQLRHAAEQYLLGVSKDGGVVFWQIDEQQRIRTGKVMYYQTDCHRIKSRNPTWVHSLLKRQLPEGWALHRCLFGQHLLSGKAPVATVCVVESEKTAVICSEQIADCLWLACGGLQMFSAPMLQPLVDYKVVIFPDTDATGDTFRQWQSIALDAQKQYQFKYPIRVSNLLESKATPEQKARKIDIADYLFESSANSEGIQRSNALNSC